MSASFNISSSQGEYTVAICGGLLAQALEQDGRDIIIIADAFFANYLAEAGLPFLTVSAEETSKSLDAVPEIIVQLRQFGCNRQSHLVALGGGIIQDLAAFVASVYMRGIPWIYIPSTLLSMVDSCIGGKSSINVGEYKNIVGTFHPPISIFIDPDLAKTLSVEQAVAGLIEAAKICYCRGTDVFERYLSYEAGPDLISDTVEEVIAESLSAKKWFIEIDEFDRKERLLLNFGHTFGHAIEGASHFRISHGVAVGVGMLCAIAIAPYLQVPLNDNVLVNKLKQHIEQLLTAVPGLGSELSSLVIADILERFAGDKKHQRDAYVVVGLGQGGEVKLIQLPKTAESLSLIAAGLSQVIGKLST